MSNINQLITTILKASFTKVNIAIQLDDKIIDEQEIPLSWLITVIITEMNRDNLDKVVVIKKEQID